MDATAFALAATHHQVVRIFSIFEDDALIKAARNLNLAVPLHKIKEMKC